MLIACGVAASIGSFYFSRAQEAPAAAVLLDVFESELVNRAAPQDAVVKPGQAGNAKAKRVVAWMQFSKG